MALVDEENLFGLVALGVEDIVLKQILGLEFRDQVYQKLLRLIIEELYGLDDLTMSLLDQVIPDRGWQALVKLIPVPLIEFLPGLILHEHLNLPLSFRGQIIPNRIVSESLYLLIQYGSFLVDVSDDAIDIADDILVVIDSKYHPNEG